MGQLVDSIEEYLKSEEWPCNRCEDTQLLQTAVFTKSARWAILIQVDEDAQLAYCYSICPINAPVHLRVKVSEYLMRVNRGAGAGNFAMDFDDGEIRYKTVMYAEGGAISDSAMEMLLDANIGMMNRYLPGIMSVIYSEATPAEALAEILTGRAVDKRYIYN